MRLWSPAWANGETIPERFALARLDGDGGLAFSANLSPPLAWSGLPEGTRSLALVCHDFDSPIDAGERVRAQREPSAVSLAPVSAADAAAAAWGVPTAQFPAALARHDFFHWLLVDLPPTTPAFVEGQWSRGFTAGGKPASPQASGARQGANDFTGLFAACPGLAGRYFGYDGPFPPPGDALVHHCVFALFALSVDRLALQDGFTGIDLRRAMAGQVLASATHSGTCTLNRRLASAGP